MDLAATPGAGVGPTEEDVMRQPTATPSTHNMMNAEEDDVAATAAAEKAAKEAAAAATAAASVEHVIAEVGEAPKPKGCCAVM